MAIIIPDMELRKYNDVGKDQDIKSSAEKCVCEWIEKSIKDDLFEGTVIGALNRTVEGREADIVLIIPGFGVLIVEIKAYSRNFIEVFTDNQEIEVKSKDNPIRKHPYNQAREYALTFMNFFKDNENDYIRKYGTCAFVPLVAMPNISTEEYKELGLDMLYGINGTLTSDWLKDEETFSARFKNAVKYAFKRVHGADFDLNYYRKVIKTFRLESALTRLEEGTSIENLEVQQESNQPEVKKDLPQKVLTREDILEQLKAKSKITDTTKQENWDYSRRYILSHSLGEEKITTIIKSALKAREEGTKVILLCEGFNEAMKFQVGEILGQELKDSSAKKDLEKYEPMQRTSWITFLLEVHFLNRDIEDEYQPVLCKNGDITYRLVECETNKEVVEQLEVTDAKCEELIQLFSSDTGYNDEQFNVEHADYEADVLVTAGAGTGKTFSMLGRIAYLIHMNILQGQEDIKLSDMIYMMTFTNNSTNEMRSRLLSHFEKYYLLTKKDCYMNVLEQIGSMKIKTIDAMAKMMLTKYAHILGLSKDFAIKSGNYVKQHIIKRRVQEYLNQNIEINEFISHRRLMSYELEQVIGKLIGYISNRNIYLDGTSCVLNEENGGDNDFRDFLQTVVKNSIDEYREYNINNNSLEMESIVTWLSQYREDIKKEKEAKEEQKAMKRYLFIDEFQDTDKHQISLIAFFAELYNLTLFVVGDRKQSIYGFRGAQDTAFDELEKVLTTRTFNTPYTLKKNYRTDSQLLTIFDELFKCKFKGDKFVYEANDELVPQLNILQLNEETEKIFNRKLIENGTTQILGENLDTVIKELKERIKEQPTKKKDKSHTIAILTRTNDEKDVIRRLNTQYGWNVKFDTEGEFYRQDAVIDFYKLVGALLNPLSAEYVYNLSLTPYCMCNIPKGRFYFGEANAIQTLEDLDGAQEFSFGEYQRKIRKITGLKLLKDLVNKNKPWERYIPESMLLEVEEIASDEYYERLRAVRGNYQRCLDQLFQTLIESNGTEYITLNQIETNLGLCIITKQSMELYKDINVESTDTDKEKDEVKIEVICTTIHKSKGLEYRSVILPFTTSDIGKVTGNELILDHMIHDVTHIEYSLRKKTYNQRPAAPYYTSKQFEACVAKKKRDQIAEELRILYVAMTRAEAEFYYLVNKEEAMKNEKGEFWAKYLKRLGGKKS